MAWEHAVARMTRRRGRRLWLGRAIRAAVVAANLVGGGQLFQSSAGWAADGSLSPAAPGAPTAPLPPPPRDPESSRRAAHVHKGFTLQLVASEPLVADPVAIEWAPDGRLWVAEMADYPYGMDGQGKPGGRIRFLEDVDQDGVYDRSVVFLDEVSFPTAVMPWRDGVLVTAAPELFFARDTNGDGKADERTPLFRGFIEGNQQLRVNGLQYGLDHWIHCASGGHHAGFGKDTTLSAVRANESIVLGSRDFRFNPDTGQLQPQSGPSQFGRVRDDWGNWFGVQNSFPLWHYVLDDSYLRRNPRGRYPDARLQLRLPSSPTVYPAKSPEKRYHSFEQAGHYTSACGPSIYRDAVLFGESDRVHAFTCEPFHNVVQRHTVWRDGVSFRAERAETDEPLDFFATEDQWSRPVMTKTGPDGSVWIVDMYRYMIEHPDWLPPEGKEELRPHYRKGEGMGRIYRIYPSDQPPARMPRIDQENDAQLVTRLSSRNGVVRDWAQRLLVERNATAVAPALRSVATDDRLPQSRAQALATLRALDRLEDDTLVHALRDEHAEVRRWAVKLAESRANASDSVKAALLERQGDVSPFVRLQLACSLGEVAGPDAGRALAELAASTADDPFLNAAMVSSIPPHFAAMAATPGVFERMADGMRREFLAQGIAHPAALADVLHPLLSDDRPETREDRMRWMAEWLEVLREENLSLADLSKSSQADPAAANGRRWDDIRAELLELQDAAWQVALDDGAPESSRLAALSLARHDWRHADEYEPRLVELLDPRTPSSVQLAALRALATGPYREFTRNAILERWSGLLPDVRQAIAEQFLNPVDAAALFLDRVEQGSIASLDLDAARRDRWVHHPDAAIAERAARLLQDAGRADRQAVVDRYRDAVALEGSVDRGEKLFAKHCATCHQPREGSPIGPELRSLTDRSPASLLVAILDPSRAVEPRYLGYHVETKSGEVIYGVVVSESGDTLGLRQVDGQVRKLGRDSLEAITSSQRSFMPDGLEAELSSQDLADVMRYVGQLK